MITIEQVIEAWRCNEQVNRLLLDKIPDAGFAVVPLLKGGKPGRGRDVGRMFAHMFDVRISHCRKTETDQAGKMPEFEKGATPARQDLVRAFEVSGKAVELRLSGALEAGETIRKHHPLNFLGYLISHDSHHRGQMLLALKQNGFALTDDLRWGPWGVWFK